MPDGQNILVRSTRDPLKGRSVNEFMSALAGLLSGRVDQAWAFGSVGTPDFGPESDIDIILVVRTDTPFLERARDFFDVMDLALAMDLLVYTPEEFERLTTNPSPGFWASAVASMRRVV